MAVYDIDSKYSDDLKVGLTELSNEILSEIDVAADENGAIDTNSIYKKLTNPNGSGILDKLKNKLDFDMKKLSNGSDSETFDMLRILKLLYKLEKSRPKGNKIRITDLLAKPRLANIITTSSDSKGHAKIFQTLYSQIKRVVEDADFRNNTLNSANMKWQFITVQAFNHVLSNKAIMYPDESYWELYRIKDFLEKKVYSKLEQLHIDNSSQQEGVMKTFYNMLACHELLCIESAKIAINQQIKTEVSPEPAYVEKFKKTETISMSCSEILEELRKRLSGKTDATHVDYIIDLITYGKGIPKNEVSYYTYAIDHVVPFIRWWCNYLHCEYTGKVSIDWLCVVIQEIVECRKNKTQMSHDYLGYNNTKISIKSALSDPDNADPLVVQAWMVRLENRLCLNLGTVELLKIKREIENIIYEIKKIIYSYHNLDDLLFVNDFLIDFVYITIISRYKAVEFGNEFFGMVIEQVHCKLADTIKLVFDVSSPNVLNMFRDFLRYRYDYEHVVEDVATKIIRAYYDSSGEYFRAITEFSISYAVDSANERRFVYIIRKLPNSIYVQAVGYEQLASEAYEKNMIRLGLGVFLKDSCVYQFDGTPAPDTDGNQTGK